MTWAPTTPKDLEDRYGFAIRSVSPMADSSRAWLIDSARGTLVLRLHGPERAAAIAGETTVLCLLEKADYPAPRLMTNASGQLTSAWGDRTGYLTTFVPGDEPQSTPDCARRLGVSTGMLHALSPPEGVAPTMFNVAVERDIFFKLDSDPSVRAWEGYTEIRAQLTSAWEQLSDFRGLPSALVHTDITFENSVQTASGEVVLIDWDDVGLGPVIQDVGYFLVHNLITSSCDEDFAIARAFLDGYETARPLIDGEWDQLPDALLFGALVYVLAPWESRIFELNWRRARHVLDHGERIRDTLHGTAGKDF